MILCPSCDATLSPSDASCPSCGLPVVAQCAECAAQIAAGARFCSECGAPVRSEPSRSPAPAIIAHHLEADTDIRALWPEGEKRRLTLLFCDLVDSTSIGQRLDPEEYSDLIEAYVGQAAGAIEQHGGYVSQVQGDGIVAYFGFPAAHENDPERAVRAGLAIHESLQRFSDGFGQARLHFQARVGIHSGPVVVNEVGRARRELLALGDTPNTAARVESVTPPGKVGISEATRKLVGELFDISPAGHHQVKGIDDPLEVFTVEGIADRNRRDDAIRMHRTSPFVGRDYEHGVLSEALSSAAAGRGATIVISGEAGIGKSRLADAMVAEAQARGLRAVTIKCSSHGGANAFDPIIDLITKMLEVPAGSDARTSAALIEDRLAKPGFPIERTLPYLLALEGLPPSARYPLPVLGAELQRDTTVRAVVSTVRHLAAQVPTVVLVEDLHWIDPSSLAVLVHLAADSRSTSMLLLLTTRPTFEWPRDDKTLRVDRLDTASSLLIVRAAAKGAPLTPEAEDQIVSRADGVPLFLEELTASVIEAGDLDSIPVTLQDSLTARLDRLGPRRAFAQIGALIGREFDRGLLAAVAQVSTENLDAGLAHLVDSGILNTDDSSRYAFKHALIQDAAAASLVRRTRRRLNSDIVDALTASFPEVVEGHPSRLARHCVEAGRSVEAIGHYRRAAARAAARLANQEATDHLERALALFDTLDEAERTAKLEIELRAEYGGPLASQHGLLGEPVVVNYRRLEQLEGEAEDIGDQLGALLALVIRYVQVSEMASLVKAGTRLLQIADSMDIPIFSAVGHVLCGVGGSTVLPPAETLAHFGAVEALAAQGHLPPPSSNYETDLQVLAASTKSINLVIMGRVSEARERRDFAVRRAEIELEHPFSRGTALTLASNVHLELGEAELCLRSTGEAIELARRHGFSHFEAMNLVQHGWARTATGGDGSDDIRLGLKLLATSTMSSYTHQVRVAAMEALLRGETSQARSFVDAGVNRAQSLHEHGYLVFLWRVSGLIELAEERPERAVALLLDAFAAGQSTGHWLPAFSAALDLFELASYANGHDADVKLQTAIDHLIGVDDHPDVVRARAILA